MSSLERDPLDVVINGEWARDKDIAYLEELATEIIEGEYACYTSSFCYELDLEDEHPSLTIKRQIHEEEALDGSAICIEVGDLMQDEPRLTIVFGYNNEIYDIDIAASEDTDSLIEAFNITDTLLSTGSLDENGMRIAVQLKKIIESLKGVRIPTSLGKAENGRHIADIAREIIEENTSHAVEIRECQIPLSDNCSIEIMLQQVVSLQPDVELPQKPLLQINLEDRHSGQEWHYYGPEGGIPSLQVSMLDEEDGFEDYTSEEMESEELELLMDQLHPMKISDHDVALLVYKLLEAQSIDAEHDANTDTLSAAETQQIN